MANIIRALPAPTRRIDGEVYAARLEAERLLAEARGEALELVEVARAQADAVREGAREEGRREAAASAAETLAWAAAERDRLLATVVPEVVRLALAVAGKVLGREAELGRGIAADMAARALADARDRTCVAVRVHPADLAEVREREGTLSAAVPRASGIAWIADPAVGRGGVIVETESGAIDARLEAQLGAVARVLATVRR